VKQLVVNADDLGLCPSVNDGVAHAHDAGIVTSASLMVRQPAAAAASAMAKQRPGLSLGLHLDIGEWAKGPDGWVSLYQVVDTHDERAVRAEARRQVELFRSLYGADPTHLDSHQHVHREEPCATVLRELGAELAIPVRDGSPRVRYRGDFYGQSGGGDPLPEAITSAALIGVIESIDEGITELGCHPAHDENVVSVYGFERAVELRALCDPSVRQAVRDRRIDLVSFAQVRR
jgi:predicted glycoside hydrolase/deacetylase ChbG (UPF0249 family)